MMKVRILIGFASEDGRTVAETQLDGPRTAQALRFLLGPPLGPMRIADWLEAAGAAFGGREFTPAEATGWMLAHGWRSKSPRPGEVVAASLRARRRGRKAAAAANTRQTSG